MHPISPTWTKSCTWRLPTGQYRYAQFAWRGAAETKSLALHFTGSANENVDLYAGEKPGSPSAASRKLAEAVPSAWQVVRVDLWEAFAESPSEFRP